MQKSIRIALNAASKSTNKYFSHGCVITYGGKPVITSCNTNNTFCHAESIAVRKLCEKGP